MSRYRKLLEELTTQEKVSLVSGHGMWRTPAVKRLGIPSLVMADGPNGLRYSPSQADENADADFSDFISMVNERRAKAAEVRKTEPATCFPTASLVGTAWDPDLAFRLGQAMAAEAALFDVGILLGPGMNLRRTPLAGRTSEYYSEDPILTAVMAAGTVEGLQSRGVGACIKHFAANNSEVERTSMDSVIEERALHDVYLRGFELVIKQARPWMVMSSYNRLSGIQAAQNRWLLSEVLRDLWGFEGVVVSDWHGITDRPASLIAGNDLDMPQSRNRTAKLEAAVNAGEVRQEPLDQSAGRILSLISTVEENQGLRPSHSIPDEVFKDSHEVAHEAAAAGSVLLANDGTLPFDKMKGQRLLVLGEGAAEPIIQGFGSARMTPVHLDIPLEEIKSLAGAEHVDYLPGVVREGDTVIVQGQELRAAAHQADAAVVFAHAPQSKGGENSDRKDLSLDTGYDELIRQAARTGLPTVVVLTVPDAVTMPWLEEVSAVLVPFYAGQAMGRAVAQLLFGQVNPSGKLATTFPQRVEDIPGFHTYPGEAGEHFYSEGPYAGYRSYQVRGVEPLFPFGFGLSYTTFEISHLRMASGAVKAGEELRLMADIENTGNRDGAEVVQVYFILPWANRPTVPQLAAFQKVHLEAGEKKQLSIAVPMDRFSIWDSWRHRRVLPPGPATLYVGNSSQSLPLTGEVAIAETGPAWRPLRRQTEPAFALENPLAREAVTAFIVGKLQMPTAEADAVLQECAKSFVNVFDTLANRFDLVLDEAEIEELIQNVQAQEQELYPPATTHEKRCHGRPRSR
ncbi:beta-glucosidase family protein [Nesterenkonia ebinurensis]|uniref:beta-glucosidase family protein n=1 Tax=Nesterenkonia ebinurensis TaxID=2608252 RepID=UPI00123D1E82|nr:glycoside hydrolase family 3 C-terminal domain-containing protein [Nesterenkonia ebinurensis]